MQVTTVTPIYNEHPEQHMKKLKQSIRKMENATTREEFYEVFQSAEEALSGVYALSRKLPKKCGVCGKMMD